MRTIIHVAQDAIRANTKDGGTRPAIIVRRGSKPTRHSEIEIKAADGTLVGTFIYSPHKPLSCGARLWLQLEEGFNAEPR
jgi:hypothetical protein